MLVFLLLTSGCVTFCSQVFEYRVVTESKGMEEARRYCAEHGQNLAAIRDQDDLERLARGAAAGGVTSTFWIGLRHTGQLSWRWSVGETDIGAGVYTNWADLPDSSHDCGGMNRDGRWVSDVCEATRPFVCQRACIFTCATTVTGGALAIFLTGKSWRSAQDYCRQNHGDLASARDETESRALHTLIQNTTMSSAWVGLFRDGWQWIGETRSSFRAWLASQPNRDGDCVLHDPGTNRWYDRGCEDKHYFCCQRGEYTETKAELETPVHKYMVRVKWKSDSSLDLNDAGVREVILKQLQEKHEGVKLQWVVPPDGNVFQREKKKKKEEEEEETLDRACGDLN